MDGRLLSVPSLCDALGRLAGVGVIHDCVNDVPHVLGGACVWLLTKFFVHNLIAKSVTQSIRTDLDHHAPHLIRSLKVPFLLANLQRRTLPCSRRCGSVSLSRC